MDVALWDIDGKAARLPVFKLLGAQRNEIPAYASYPAAYDTPDGFVGEAKDTLARGFGADSITELSRHKQQFASLFRACQLVAALSCIASDRQSQTQRGNSHPRQRRLFPILTHRRTIGGCRVCLYTNLRDNITSQYPGCHSYFSSCTPKSWPDYLYDGIHLQVADAGRSIDLMLLIYCRRM